MTCDPRTQVVFARQTEPATEAAIQRIPGDTIALHQRLTVEVPLDPASQRMDGAEAFVPERSAGRWSSAQVAAPDVQVGTAQPCLPHAYDHRTVVGPRNVVFALAQDSWFARKDSDSSLHIKHPTRRSDRRMLRAGCSRRHADGTELRIAVLQTR